MATASMPPGAAPTGFPFAAPPVDPALLPHNDRGPMLVGVGWLLLSLSGIIMSLRIYCKLIGSRRLWWDDYVLIAAWTVLLAEVIDTTYFVSLGYGKHMWDFNVANLPKMLIPLAAKSTMAITAEAWSKTSFAITLLRISDGWTKRFVWFAIVTINVLMGLSALLSWIQCKPLNAGWDLTVVGTCWDPKVMLVINQVASSYSGVMDICLALLPWRLIMHLQMKKKEKIGVAVAMSMGVFAGGCAFAKAANLYKLYSTDIADGVDLMIWDMAETAVTIIAASIPVLRVLVKDIRTTMRNYRMTGGDNTKVSQVRTRTTRVRPGSDDAESNSIYKEDARSDKSILEEAARTAGQDGIVRTQAISVQYQPRGKGDTFEMGRIPS